MKKIISAVLTAFLCLQISVLAENNTATRIEFVASIVSALDIDFSPKDIDFADLSKDNKYYRVAVTAAENGIINGYGSGSIKPFDSLTREDAIVFLCRAYRITPAAELYLTVVSDRADISPYASGYVSAAIHNNIISHTRGDKFNPKECITTEEMRELIDCFKKHEKTQLNFSRGYPRESSNKKYGAVSVSLKTTLPCVVYYKLLPSDTYLSSYRPNSNEITEFLTPIGVADTVVDMNIFPPDNREYNLYIMAVDESGKNSVCDVIYNVKAHPYTSGDGSKENPYLIYTEEQLRGIEYLPDSHFRLENDITLSDTWQPIEINTHGRAGFAGVLDGNYHKIKNLTIHDNEKNTGIFREIHGGTIKRLYVDATVNGSQNVGIITGRLAGGSISECFVTGRVHADSNNAGAIVGVNEGIITNCVAAAYIVEASGYAGGICGANREGEITNCLSAVYSVSSNMYASGIAGINNAGTITNSVCANMYADDVITTKSGRVTTNKLGGTTQNNYCYDKMFSGSNVNFGYDTHDGTEITWQELVSPEFYRDTLGWDTKSIWTGGTDADFRLPCPGGFESIDMIKGITMYAPIKISNKDELLAVGNDTTLHYILTANISLKDCDWKIISENGNEEDGFSGSFDGDNHTISNMYIGTKTSGGIYGMFGVISSGTVRNLKLTNLTIDGESLAGGIAAENYGYIENCSVSGKIYTLRKDNMLSAGGICANNYGFIESCSASVKIRADGQVLTIGGICANNEGNIYDCSFNGTLNAELSDEYTNAVVGGICGINTNGMIYNCFAAPQALAKACTNYVGGICGIANGGEIYMSASAGNAVIKSKRYESATAYIGGIAALAPDGLVMNSFSNTDLSADSNAIYAGGIIGYNMNSSIQNVYSTNEIDADGKSFSTDAPCYAGGICGFSENGFISASVAINGKVFSNGICAAIGNSDGNLCTYSDNYSVIETKFNGECNEYSENGTLTKIKNTDASSFFFKPIAEGGTLGWVEGDVWYREKGYRFPLLYRVDGQEKMKVSFGK